MTTASPTILNEELAAERIGSTVRKVRQWIRSGKIPGRILPDGSVLTTAEALAVWVDGGKLEEQETTAPRKRRGLNTASKAELAAVGMA